MSGSTICRVMFILFSFLSCRDIPNDKIDEIETSVLNVYHFENDTILVLGVYSVNVKNNSLDTLHIPLKDGGFILYGHSSHRLKGDTVLQEKWSYNVVDLYVSVPPGGDLDLLFTHRLFDFATIHCSGPRNESISLSFDAQNF
ncbi:MAG: hypothetical protein GC193_03340 [Cryomorphaceae bacterium]|nr:hypothetical protein [Cryomorphaceae bacterium]